MRTTSLIVGGALTLLVTIAGIAARKSGKAATIQIETTRTWQTYGGQPEGDHYSDLAQINRDNVSKLKVACTFDTGEEGELETNPHRDRQCDVCDDAAPRGHRAGWCHGQAAAKWQAPARVRSQSGRYILDRRSGNGILVGYSNSLYALHAKNGTLSPARSRVHA